MKSQWGLESLPFSISSLLCPSNGARKQPLHDSRRVPCTSEDSLSKLPRRFKTRKGCNSGVRSHIPLSFLEAACHFSMSHPVSGVLIMAFERDSGTAGQQREGMRGEAAFPIGPHARVSGTRQSSVVLQQRR